MDLNEIFTAEAIAANWTEAASNRLPYYGEGLFPANQKMGLDLKWILGNKGLPVSLAPSTFDAKSTLRDRVNVEIKETEMAFFRESMVVKESDEQEIMRVQDSNDKWAQPVLKRVFDDAGTLVDGAVVVGERMRMQLLAPLGGRMGINIRANGTDYTYNYDADGSWKKEHYMEIKSAADKWTSSETCDPLQDMEDAMDAQEIAGGNRPEVFLMSKETFKLIKSSKKVQAGVLAQNTTANVNYTNAKVKAYVEEALGVTIVIYAKQYKDENHIAHKFYPDNIVMMLPSGELGNTWYGTTPEERTLMQDSEANVSIVNTGVAVTVTRTTDPVNTKTTVSEILLPSFERMEECYAIEVA